MEEATEYEWLLWFFQNADFGPAHEDVMFGLIEEFEEETGKAVPCDYKGDDE